jgi:hypothetical protein
MLDWTTFLEDVAIACALSPDQRRAFLARFDRLNAGKTEKWIVDHIKDERGDQVFSGEAAFKKLMTAVYGAVQRELFPELAKVAKGKREKLEAFLQERYRSQAPQPPSLGEPNRGEAQSPTELGGEEDARSTTAKSLGLKRGAPMPGVRLPDNFVARTAALAAVKGKLLGESVQRSSWQEICRESLNHWKDLTTNVLTKADGVSLALDEVFVPLGLVERSQKAKHHRDSGSPEKGSELYDEQVTPISQDEFFEQVLRQGQSKNSRGRRIAIIGEPGGGKTTQLQKIGDWILDKTDEIPIWIPLAAVGARLLRDYLFNDWLQTITSDVEIPQHNRDALSDLLKNGKVCLLLDGVDEMPVADALQAIASQMQEGWLRNVRIVLTCRLNVWDVGKNLLGGFDVYRNLNFDYPDEVHKFIGNWFGAKVGLQKDLKEALDVPGKERIRDMVRNPLRLTLLCYSWQLRQGELPETKARIYEWFVDTYYEWNKGKVSIQLSTSKRRELNIALGQLSKEAIAQKTSRFRLHEKFVSQFLGDLDDEDSLFYLADKLSLINRVGVAEEDPLQRVYAFLHPTFQEYFAALAINDWHFLLNHAPDNPVLGTYRVFEPQWEEVILLWFGQDTKSNAEKEEFLSALITFTENRFEFYHYQVYFLAATITSEFHSSSSASIIEQIIRWGFYLPESMELSHRSILRKEARNILSKTDINEASKLLIRIIEETSLKEIWKDSKISRADFIEYNKQISAYENQEEIEKDEAWNIYWELSCRILVHLSTHDSLSLDIIEFLVKIDPRNPVIIKQLDNILSNSAYECMGGEYFIDMMFRASKLMLENNENFSVSVSFVREFMRLDSKRKFSSSYDLEQSFKRACEINPNVLPALIGHLESTEELKKFRSIAEIISNLSDGNLLVMPLLMDVRRKILPDDHERRFILDCCIGLIDINHPVFLESLAHVIKYSDLDKCCVIFDQISHNHYIRTTRSNEYFLGERLRSLINSFFGDVEKCLAFKDAIGTEKESLEESIVLTIEFMVEKISNDAIYLPSIEALLEAISDSWHCSILAKCLLLIQPDHTKAQETFNYLLREGSEDRLEAAYYLLAASPNNKQAIDALIDLVRNEHNSEAGELAASLRIPIVKNLDLFIEFQKLLEDNDSKVRLIAAETILRMDSPTSKLASIFIDLLDDLDNYSSALHELEILLPELESLEHKFSVKLVQELILILYSKDSEYDLRRAGNLLIRHCPNSLLQDLVRNLKAGVAESVLENEPLRSWGCYRVLWHCAKNMSYVDFGQAWDS